MRGAGNGMLTVNAESESENMSGQPDREIQFRTTVINLSVYSGISAAVHLERKDTICHMHRTGFSLEFQK